MPRDAASKKPHKTSRPPKAQREAQKAAQRNAKKAAQTEISRDIAAKLKAQLDGSRAKSERNDARGSQSSYAKGAAKNGAARSAKPEQRGKSAGTGKFAGAGKAAGAGKSVKPEYRGKSAGAGKPAGMGRSGKPGTSDASRKSAKFDEERESSSFDKKYEKRSDKKFDKADGSRGGFKGETRGGYKAAAKGGFKGGHKNDKADGHKREKDFDKKQSRGSKPFGPASGKPNRAECPNRSNRTDRPERSDRPARAERSDRSARPTRAARSTARPTSAAPAKQSVFSAAVARARKTMKSPCPVDVQCGGCEAIALPYEQQLLLKNALVADLFEGVGGDFELRPILGMQDPFRYRNKIISPFAPGKKIEQSKASAGADKGDDQKKKRRQRGLTCEILTGMYEQGTHKLVPTTSCLIENEVGQQVVSAIKAIMQRHAIEPYNEDTGEGFMRHVVVRVGHESGEVLVTIVTNEEKFPAGKSFAKELIAHVPQVTTVVQNVNMRQTNVILGEQETVLYGPGFILDTLCGLSFRISSTSFYQVNATQTEVLYNTAVELAGLTGAQTVIDAYCGTGTIGLVAATRGAQRVVGVESNAAAVRDAWENAHHNGVENVTFIAADATQFMREFAQKDTDEFMNEARANAAAELGEEAEDAVARVAGFDGAAPEIDREADAALVADLDAPVADANEGAGHELVLLMDPPRAGSTPEFLQAAADLAPQRIVYVSCNPETQVRDIELLQKRGYELQIVQPVDMFPHTAHVETVALLSRK